VIRIIRFRVSFINLGYKDLKFFRREKLIHFKFIIELCRNEW